ncbi:hypothetical protein HK405_003590 [Cladochytrium tenue]|nr:hypothetical protein HK405_003590 [Cladochytrium tenue]
MASVQASPSVSTTTKAGNHHVGGHGGEAKPQQKLESLLEELEALRGVEERLLHDARELREEQERLVAAAAASGSGHPVLNEFRVGKVGSDGASAAAEAAKERGTDATLVQDKESGRLGTTFAWWSPSAWTRWWGAARTTADGAPVVTSAASSPTSAGTTPVYAAEGGGEAAPAA